MCGKDEGNKVMLGFISSDDVQLEHSLTWECIASFLFLIVINPGKINKPFTREILFDHIALRWVFVVIYLCVI